MAPDHSAASADRPTPTQSLPLNSPYRPTLAAVVAQAQPGPFMTPEMHQSTGLVPYPTTHLPSPASPVNMAAFDPQMFNGRSPIGQVPAFVTHPSSHPDQQGSYPIFMEGSSRQPQMMTPDSSPFNTRPLGGLRGPVGLYPIMPMPGLQHGTTAFAPRTASDHASHAPAGALAPAPTISPPTSRHPSEHPSPIRSRHSSERSRMPPQPSRISGQAPPPHLGSGFHTGHYPPSHLNGPDVSVIPYQTESHSHYRPEYLVRAPRSTSPAFDRFLDEATTLPMPPGLGIAVSPMKGRRLQLFQETSEESFEQSLMAGGYGKYGTNPERKTLPMPMPMPLSLGAVGGAGGVGGQPGVPMHQRTMEWLEQAQAQAQVQTQAHVQAQVPAQGAPVLTPMVTASVASVPSDVPPERIAEENVPDAREALKRKRLAAFQEDGPRTPNKLRVVDVEGMGRVLLDVPNVEPETNVEEPKKKPKAKRKKVTPANTTGWDGHGFSVSTSITTSINASNGKTNENDDPKGTNWVDTAFPWSLRATERVEGVRKQQSERLHWIARYLERESDSENGYGSDLDEAASDDEELPSPIIPLEDLPLGSPTKVFRQGGDRGAGRFVVPSEAADARWQLTNVAVRHRTASAALLISGDPANARAGGGRGASMGAEGEAEEDLDEVVLGRSCVCSGRAEGDLVQCDDCFHWYHLACLDIQDVAELGAEEEPWYCHACTGAPAPLSKYRHSSYSNSHSGSVSDDRSRSPRTPSPVLLTREPAFYSNQTPGRVVAGGGDPIVSFAPAYMESPMPSWPSSLSAPTPAVGNHALPLSSPIPLPATPRYGHTPRSFAGSMSTSATGTGSASVHSSRSTAITLPDSASRMPHTPKSAPRSHARDTVRVFGASPGVPGEGHLGHRDAHPDASTDADMSMEMYDEPFDPTATPSRPARSHSQSWDLSTPKTPMSSHVRTGSWAARANASGVPWLRSPNKPTAELAYRIPSSLAVGRAVPLHIAEDSPVLRSAKRARTMASEPDYLS